jgi:hypothetical protein
MYIGLLHVVHTVYTIVNYRLTYYLCISTVSQKIFISALLLREVCVGQPVCLFHTGVPGCAQLFLPLPDQGNSFARLAQSFFFILRAKLLFTALYSSSTVYDTPFCRALS